ncbi:MAG: hypothetical protein QG570_754 [Patescibacteria group bacterium]|nr:hypothetical protein [Patescibacteria group bacterium]
MKKLYGILSAYAGMFVLFVSPSFAQDLVGTAYSASNKFGDLDGLSSILLFVYNIFRYLGWAGVFIGIGFVLFSLIYKLFNADNEEAMKTVQGYITKAVLIVIAGLLLLSLGWLIGFVGGIFGYSITPSDPFTALPSGS